MGVDASREKAQKIVNLTARTIFLDFLETIDAQPPDVKNSSKFKKMAYAFYHSCKNQPEGTTYLSLVLTGKDIGPQFINVGINFLKTYSMITKISFRDSSLTKNEAIKFARFMKASTSIKEVDLSENKIHNEGVEAILDASIGHPRLEALILESTGASDSVSSHIVSLIKSNSNLKILRLSPIQLKKTSINNINECISKNIKLTVLTFSSQNSLQLPKIKATLNRNSEIQNIISELISTPFYRSFKIRNDLFKSVKGRRMAEGRAHQIEALKKSGFQTIYTDKNDSPQNISCQNKSTNLSVRIGASETIGVREMMEDFTIVQQDFIESGNVLIGVFDGHGGREASEYAGNNMPSLLSQQIKAQNDMKKAIETTFHEIHESIKSWGPYVGTTVCLGIIESSKNQLTVGNVGDTRCILIKKNSDEVIRLTVDHKPEMPEEKAYIESHGGFVENGRVNGILAISRCLGDSSLGEVINPTPFIKQTDINEDCILIFACDGLWDVISDQDAASIVKPEIDPMLAARKLRDSALNSGSTDNVSVVVVFISSNDDE